LINAEKNPSDAHMAATGAIMHFFGSNIQVDIMATSDNHMVDSENSETNSEATLKKQTAIC